MGMKIAKIKYHLERAAAARAGLTRAKVRGMDNETLAKHHEDKAAEYLAAGLAEYAGRADNPAARRTRAWHQAKHAGGPGRGHRGASGYVSAGGKGFVKKVTD